MRKFLSLFLCLLVVACAIPATPEDGDLINATKQFRRELFESGARGGKLSFQCPIMFRVVAFLVQNMIM